jgi:hypothetical protein
MAATLVEKLRIQAGHRMLILNAPPGYVESLGDVPEGVGLLEHPEGTFDFVHLFVRDTADYASLSPTAFGSVKYDGLLWISYPKRSSKVATDLTRDVLWKLSEGSGFRPVAQISVDGVWSAVRFRPAEKVRSRM